ALNDKSNVKTISQNLVSDGVDLILAKSTQAALRALAATNHIPIVFTSVTGPVDAKRVESMDDQGANITGVVAIHPGAYAETVAFIDTYFQDATVGLIYNAGEQNSVAQIEEVQKAAEETSLGFVERTVSNSAEVQQAASTIVEEADVIYVVTDNTVV